MAQPNCWNKQKRVEQEDNGTQKYWCCLTEGYTSHERQGKTSIWRSGISESGTKTGQQINL